LDEKFILQEQFLRDSFIDPMTTKVNSLGDQVERMATKEELGQLHSEVATQVQATGQLYRLSKIEGLGGCSEFGSLQTLYGLAASQYGESREMLKEGEMVKDYVNRLFGYRHDHLPYAAGAVVGFTIHFASGFAFSIKVTNFQRR